MNECFCADRELTGEHRTIVETSYEVSHQAFDLRVHSRAMNNSWAQKSATENVDDPTRALQNDELYRSLDRGYSEKQAAMETKAKEESRKKLVEDAAKSIEQRCSHPEAASDIDVPLKKLLEESAKAGPKQLIETIEALDQALQNSNMRVRACFGFEKTGTVDRVHLDVIDSAGATKEKFDYPQSPSSK